MFSFTTAQRTEFTSLFLHQLENKTNCSYPQINTLSLVLDAYYSILQTNQVSVKGISFNKGSDPGLIFVISPKAGGDDIYVVMGNILQPRLHMYRSTWIINMAKARLQKTFLLSQGSGKTRENNDIDIYPQIRQCAQDIYESHTQEPTFQECEAILQTAPAVIWSRHGIIALDKEPVFPREFDAAFAAGGFTIPYTLRQLQMSPNIFCAGLEDGHEDEWSANEEEFVNGSVYAQQHLHILTIIKGPIIIGRI
tara:strand:- start:750 stop:1505 length:756 start_codon:yes stop_codon:yes gene_type:complete